MQEQLNFPNQSNVSGTVTTGYIAPAQPSVCPGCGRCRTCGQPAPVNPAPVYPWYPYVGDPIPYPSYPNPIITCTSGSNYVPNNGKGVVLNSTVQLMR